MRALIIYILRSLPGAEIRVVDGLVDGKKFVAELHCVDVHNVKFSSLIDSELLCGVNIMVIMQNIAEYATYLGRRNCVNM